MPSDRLNILVLHSLGNPAKTVDFLAKHVFCLKRNQPDHNYLYHDVLIGLPDYVKATQFHAIILDVTFLCHRWSSPESFATLKQSYDFVRNTHAIKIALPQDEYDCNELLDDWMCDWNVDVVMSVISNHWDVLYPKYSKRGRILLGFTGYVDESLLTHELKPWAERRVDVGYRTRRLPPYFGRLGQNKWKIGLDVEKVASAKGFVTDIVVGDQGTLFGKAWLDFINDSKFTLGANSGSSLLDPRGEIQRELRSYIKQSPLASFDEMEEKFFKGLDGKYQFTAISPRVLEAAALKSCQILVEGDYSGIVLPWEHYIPIRADASNFEDVACAMRDTSLVQKLIARCRDSILDHKDLRYTAKADRLIALICDGVTRCNVSSPCGPVEAVITRYEREMPAKYSRAWRRQNFKHKLHSTLEKYPFMLRAARTGLGHIRKLQSH